MEQTPTTVEHWYDRNTRSWVTQILDADGFQIGDAVYSGNRRDANDAKRRALAMVEDWDSEESEAAAANRRQGYPSGGPRL